MKFGTHEDKKNKKYMSKEKKIQFDSHGFGDGETFPYRVIVVDFFYKPGTVTFVIVLSKYVFLHAFYFYTFKSFLHFHLLVEKTVSIFVLSCFRSLICTR